MSTNQQNQKADTGNKKPSIISRNQIVIIALSALCVVLMVAVIIFGIVLAISTDNSEIPSKDYTVEELCYKVQPSVVMVKSIDAIGSGVVVSCAKQNYIVTNYHVVKSDADIKASFYPTNEYVPAELIGFDAYHDIALLSFDNSASAAKAIVIDGSGAVKNGQFVLAAGNNLGSGIAFFDGIISKTSHMVSITADNKTVPTYQITAPINAGMSGGGLFDIRGNLIGINTYQTNSTNIDGAVRPVDGVSHSVPASIVEPIIRQIVYENANQKSGQIAKIYVQNTANVFNEVNFAGLNFRAAYGSDGLKVTLGGNSTEMLGGEIKAGDIITSIGDLKVTNITGVAPLFAEVLKYADNADMQTKQLQITLLRNAKPVTITYDNKRYKNY